MATTKKAVAKKAVAKKAVAKKAVAKAPVAKAMTMAQKYPTRADLGAQIDGYLAKLDAGNRAICDAFRALVVAAVPTVKSELKWGMPMFLTTTGIVCYMRAAKGYVRVGFASGAKLDDPAGVLYGSGEGSHVKLVAGAQLDAAQLTAWIAASAAHVGG